MSQILKQVDIDRMRKLAKKMRADTSKPYNQCLEEVAAARGFSSWKHALSSLEPAQAVRVDEPQVVGNHFDAASFCMDYESGELSDEDVISGFQHLINNGIVWRLQGSYGRMAERLIDQGLCNRPIAAEKTGTGPRQVGPYVDVTLDRTRQACGEEFRLLLYGAYDAMGLIGYECNGIAVLSNTCRDVVCDEIAKVDSGWGGPTAPQVSMFDKLLSCSDSDFFETLSNSPRLRRPINTPPAA